jgi:hypothetical protein
MELKNLNSNRLRSLTAAHDNWMKKYKIDGHNPSSIQTFDAKYHFETRNTVKDRFYYSSQNFKEFCSILGCQIEAF